MEEKKRSDLFEPQEQAELEAFRHTDSFIDEALNQLDRILASQQFSRVRQQARDFLRFVVSKTLLSRSTEVKEATIAIHVFHEPADYDSAESSKIRVAAADLRAKLFSYYEDEGQNDPVQITIPTGTYVPEIRDRKVSIAISVFENWNPRRDQDYLCATLSDEIAHRLSQAGAMEARRVPALENADHGFQYGLRGSLECGGDRVRLNLSLSDLRTGKIISGERFEGPRDDIFKLSAQAASTVVATLRPKERGPSRSKSQS